MQQNFDNMVKPVKLYLTDYLSNKDILNLSLLDKKHGEIFKDKLSAKKEEFIRKKFPLMVEKDLDKAANFIESNVLNKQQLEYNKSYFEFIRSAITTAKIRARDVAIRLLIKYIENRNYEAINMAKNQITKWNKKSSEKIKLLTTNLIKSLGVSLNALIETKEDEMFNADNIYYVLEIVKYWNTQKSKNEAITKLSNKILEKLNNVICRLESSVKDKNIDAMDVAKTLIEKWGQAQNKDVKKFKDQLFIALEESIKDLVELSKKQNEKATGVVKKLANAWGETKNIQIKSLLSLLKKTYKLHRSDPLNQSENQKKRKIDIDKN